MIPKNIQKKIKQATELNQKKQYTKAKRVCQEIIKKHKDLALAWKLLATNALCLQQWEQAIEAIKKAIHLGDHELTTYQLLANIYLESNRLDLAEQLFTELFNKTGEISLLQDLALTLHRMGEYTQAEEVYGIITSRDPDNTKAQFNKTILELYTAPYGDTWQGYHLRHLSPDASKIPQAIAPIWQGESLTGKHILIWQEQGIADQIIFTRAFSSIAEDAKQVTVICEPRLQSLLQNSYPNICFIILKDKNYQPLIEDNFDYQVFAGDLPLYYLNSKQKISNPAKQLICPEHLNQALAGKLSGKIKIGLSWFGGAAHFNSQNRWSLSTEALISLIKTKEDATYYSLQYGNYTEQKKQLRKQGITIIDIPEYGASGDFANYAALIQQMDLVIAVDNSAAVLAAALGKEVWILHPADPFWVWGGNSSNTWYSNTRHFIKPWNTDWLSFIENEVKPALHAKLKDLEL